LHDSDPQREMKIIAMECNFRFWTSLDAYRCEAQSTKCGTAPSSIPELARRLFVASLKPGGRSRGRPVVVLADPSAFHPGVRATILSSCRNYGPQHLSRIKGPAPLFSPSETGGSTSTSSVLEDRGPVRCGIVWTRTPNCAFGGSPSSGPGRISSETSGGRTTAATLQLALRAFLKVREDGLSHFFRTANAFGTCSVRRLTKLMETMRSPRPSEGPCMTGGRRPCPPIRSPKLLDHPCPVMYTDTSLERLHFSLALVGFVADRNRRQTSPTCRRRFLRPGGAHRGIGTAHVFFPLLGRKKGRLLFETNSPCRPQRGYFSISPALAPASVRSCRSRRMFPLDPGSGFPSASRGSAYG